MKKSSIIVILLISALLLGGCLDNQVPILKGSYQNKSDINGKFIQLAVDNRENTFVLYINSRQVNKGTFEKESDNLYKMSGDVQEFQIHLENDNSFNIKISGVSNDFPIKMENTSKVPTYFPASYGDEDEYKELLFEEFKSDGIENDKAYQNCIEYIENSSFDRWKKINTIIARAEKVTETIKESVVIDKGKESLLDTTDLIYIIGDTSEHDFANIVCDSETKEVIGYIPIK